jgi:hypothetical protein
LIVLGTVFVTAIVTHWIDRSTDTRHDVTGRELAAAAEWLDDLYAAPDGLQRTGGLCAGGRLDRAALSAWLFEGYLDSRRQSTPQEARAAILESMKQTEEWRQLRSR